MKLNNDNIGVYPDIYDDSFYTKLNNKKEFYENRIDNNKVYDCFQNNQSFLSNYINPLTQYQSILIHAETGVGKTGAAIAIAQKFISQNYKVLVVVKNKLLQLNFLSEIESMCSSKFKPDLKKYNFITDQKLIIRTIGKKEKKNDTIRRVIKNPLKNINNTVLIVDEAHNITGNDTYHGIMKLLKGSVNVRVVLMTATPIYDSIDEIFVLGNVLNFYKQQIDIKQSSLIKDGLIKIQKNEKTESPLNTSVYRITSKGKQLLKKIYKGHLSFLSSDTTYFPKKVYHGTKISDLPGSLKVFKCMMGEFQSNHYQKTLINEQKKSSGNEQKSSVKVKGIGLFNESTNASIIVYPDGSTGTTGYTKFIKKSRDHSFLKKENIKKYSTKLHSILENIEKSKGPVFVYSNFVNENGIDIIKAMLNVNGYSQKYMLLDISKTDKQKQNMIKRFNKPENKHGELVKILLGSPMISEGLTLKNVRQIHILEAYWNFSKIDQIIGRGVRFMSHSILPESERVVDVYLYTAIAKNVSSIDLLKYQLSEQKDIASKEIQRILKETAVDCMLNYPRNLKQTSVDYSRDCEYQTCKFTCDHDNHTPVSKIDNTTYDLFYHDPNSIDYIKSKVAELFTHGYYYTIDYIVDIIQKHTPQIPKENVYLVLGDLLGKPIRTINGIPWNLMNVSDVFFINPIDKPVNTQFMDKLLKRQILSKSVSVIKKKSSEKPKKIIPITLTKSEISKIKQHQIYGTMLDKNGIKDNLFRIVTDNTTNKDNRKNISGKVCLSYNTDLLRIILSKLNLSKGVKIKKEKMCEILQNYFKDSGKLIF